MSTAVKVEHFTNSLRTQLVNRILTGYADIREDVQASVEVTLEDNTLWIKLHQNGDTHPLTIPMPFINNGTQVIEVNGAEQQTLPRGSP